MAHHPIPQFANDIGVEKIHVGVKEFKCVGAKPPYDHPHIFLDMGEADQTVCPYCSTLFIFDPNLGPEQSDPPYCCFHGEGEQAA